jgi:hypothetical protein
VRTERERERESVECESDKECVSLECESAGNKRVLFSQRARVSDVLRKRHNSSLIGKLLKNGHSFLLQKTCRVIANTPFRASRQSRDWNGQHLTAIKIDDAQCATSWIDDNVGQCQVAVENAGSVHPIYEVRNRSGVL